MAFLASTCFGFAPSLGSQTLIPRTTLDCRDYGKARLAILDSDLAGTSPILEDYIYVYYLIDKIESAYRRMDADLVSLDSIINRLRLPISVKLDKSASAVLMLHSMVL